MAYRTLKEKMFNSILTLRKDVYEPGDNSHIVLDRADGKALKMCLNSTAHACYDLAGEIDKLKKENVKLKIFLGVVFISIATNNIVNNLKH